MNWRIITPISILIGFTIFCGVSSGFGLNTVSAQQGSPKIQEDNNTALSTYSDDDIGFSLSYPSDWTKDTSNAQHYAVITFKSPENNASVDIRILPQGDYKTIKEYGDKTFKQSNDNTLLQYYRNSSTLLGGKLALKAIYLTTYNPNVFEKAMGYQSSTSKAMMVATMVPEKKSIFALVYFSNGSDFNKYLPTVEEMVKSFKIASKAPIIQEED